MRPCAAVDGREVAPDVEQAVDRRDREHLTARAGAPAGDQGTRALGDRCQPRLARSPHVGERAAHVDVVADDADGTHGAVRVRVPREERTRREAHRREVVARHLAGAERVTRRPQRRELATHVHRRSGHRDDVHAPVRLPGRHGMGLHRNRLRNARRTQTRGQRERCRHTQPTCSTPHRISPKLRVDCPPTYPRNESSQYPRPTRNCIHCRRIRACAQPANTAWSSSARRRSRAFAAE